MWILQDIPISHETLLIALLLGFLLLAGLCLSARAFTQVLAFLAKRGSLGEVKEPDDPQAPTT